MTPAEVVLSPPDDAPGLDEVCGGKLGRMWHRILGRAAAISFVISGALLVPQTAPAQNKKWVQLFNGKSLDGWVPKFSGFDLGVNYNDTFRVENGLLLVSYDKWADFGDPPHFGHLFYKNKKFSHYVVAVEYRFVGEQVKGGPGWALRNNGVMLHCQAPETMGKDQDFPISVEAQLLGGGPTGERTTANMCSPGTEVYQNGVKVPSHCITSSSQTYRDGEWVRVEIEVDGADKVVHRINGKTVLEYGKLEIGGGNVI
ncbi:MAG: hypothetical protein JWN34_126, partial [Bryobacterales bacterium]|nr:hypothetical protein [Bryobacterales bacterium]